MLDLDLCRRPSNYPRNLWTRLRVALHLIENRAFLQAKRVIEGARYHPDMTEPLMAVFQGHLESARAAVGAVWRIDIPSDYLGSANPRLLKPFRRLDPNGRFPKPYNWAMPLPEFVGTGNDGSFLLQAAASLAGSFTPARRHIRVYYSPLDATLDECARTLETLSDVKHEGRLDISVFGVSQISPSLTLPGGGQVETLAFPLQSEAGQRYLTETAQDCDLILFLSGEAQFDSMAMARALHIAEISDAVVQPLIAHKAAKKFSTLFTQAPGQGVFSRRYPFRYVNGLNLILSPALLSALGPLDARFESTHHTGRELCYRAFVRGAYFLPLTLSELSGYEDFRGRPADDMLLRHLTPNSWDRKQDGQFEVAKVSVYIPAYNAAKYIERAVDSVLDQDVEDLDICIANDGSRDNTLDLLQHRYGDNPRVKLLDNPNGGISFASNSAIRLSRSLYIGQLDSDDCLKPGAVRRLMTYLDENPRVVCAYGSCERIDADGNFIKNEYSWPAFSREKMMITSIAHHFRMFRRGAWERTTRFREDIVNGVDYDIFLKMSEVGEFHHIDEILYQRRWHGENTSSVNEHHQTTNTYRVQRETLQRLGLDRNWDIHLPDPTQPRLVTYQLCPDTRMVVFWPDYSRANPYQKLLYRDLQQEAEVVSGTIEAALKLLDTKIAKAEDVTFHLHWLNALFRDCKTDEEACAVVEDFVGKVENFIRKGGRFVWTIHNAVSHDTPFFEIEIDLSSRLAAAAHALHFHAAASVEEVDAVFPIPRNKVIVARHGHYIGVYPDYVTRETAREALGIDPDDDVIVFTGQIRSYKGIDTLIAAFRRILVDRPQARLILAGKSDSDPLADYDPDLTEEERARILCTGRFVEDGELQLFLRAADMAAYPYDKILTSGSLLLALSYGVPSVIPRVGMTAEVLDGRDAGVLYDGNGGVSALEAALRSLLGAKDAGKLPNISDNAKALAESQEWFNFNTVIGCWNGSDAQTG
jgi:glycosyltransferase involved in cell wall biosynthesis